MSWDGFELEKAYRTCQEQDKRVEQRQDKRWAAQDFVRTLLAERAIWLIDGASSPPDGPAVVELLLKDINAQSDTESRRLARNFLVKGIARGVQEKKWCLRVPHQTLRTRLPKPPITSTTFFELGRITSLRSAFYESLKDPRFVHKLRRKSTTETNTYGGPELDLRRGRVLLAMVIFGGVVRKSNLKAMAQLGPDSLCCHGDVLWLEWKKENEFDGVQESWLRWYPEQVSGLLVATAHSDGIFPVLAVAADGISNAHEKAIWAQILAVLKLLRVKKARLPKSLAELIRWTKTWLHFNIPPVLAHFAGGPSNGASLPPAAHIRVITGQKEAPTAVASTGEALVLVRDAQQGIALACPLATNAEMARLHRELRAIFSSSQSKPKKVVLARIEAYLQQASLPASFVRLAQWTKSMLVHRRRGTGKLRLSSISSYLLRVDKRISVILEDRDPAFLDEDGLADMYSEIVCGLPERSMARVIIALRKFHEFLVTEFAAPDEAGEVFDGYGCGSPIDANVLSLVDYRLAFARLSSRQTGQPLWLGKMQQVALMLGYRGLLRRGEVHRLRIGDVLGNKCGVIYVRSTETGLVKSAAAIRNILYDGNLPEDEALILREFIDNRSQQITGMGPGQELGSAASQAFEKMWATPLFQEPGTANLVSITLLFKQITAVLHQVTGTEQSHFHLARKGGLNWKLLVVFEEELPGCSLFLDPSGDAQKASEDLHRSLMASDHGDRRKLWALSCLAGHATPATTIGSYITCLDWLLGYSLRGQEPLPDSIVSAVIGRTETDIRTQRSRKKIMRVDYLPLIKNDWLSKVKIKVEIQQQNSQEYLTESSPLSPEFQIDSVNILRLLNKAMTDENKIERLAIDNQILSSTIKSWVATIKKLDGFSGASNIRSNGGLTLPKTPLQAAEKNRLNILTELMNRFAKINRHEMLEWLKMLFLNHSKRDNAVIFYNLANAATFYKTLQSIISGVDLEIGISLAPLVRKGSSSADAQIKAWLDAVNIDRADVVIEPCIARQPGPDMNGKLSIYFKSEQDNRGDKAKDNIEAIPESNMSGKEWTKTRSGALAGAAYLTRIALGNTN